ncbi:MAG TPA: TetR/AcrR family transcriptional regulator [Nitrolancea sp.]|nr:TetR/AcrR family transcriptional regulator [Nitrolancea sp.]
MASESAGRTPRADARRNRERILVAAAEVFAKNGVNASTAEVAEAAGVGIGTVFRHFPTKESLLEAVLVERLSRIADDAERRAQADDAGEAFIGFITDVVAESATKIAIADALKNSGIDVMSSTSPVAYRLRSAIGALLTRAQQAGVIRDDLDADDVIALLAGLAQATQLMGQDPAARARTLSVVIAGLRSPASEHPLNNRDVNGVKTPSPLGKTAQE